MNPENDGTAIWLERKFDVPASGHWESDTIFTIPVSPVDASSTFSSPGVIVFESTPVEGILDDLERSIHFLYFYDLSIHKNDTGSSVFLMTVHGYVILSGHYPPSATLFHLYWCFPGRKAHRPNQPPTSSIWYNSVFLPRSQFNCFLFRFRSLSKKKCLGVIACST